MIYFDNAATTKPSEIALKVFDEINKTEYFNPSASYLPAFNLNQKLSQAKKHILELVGFKNGKVIFNSGATESNNLAIFGSAKNKTKKYLFSSGEHPAVFNCAKELLQRGYNVEFVNLQRNGQIDYEDLKTKMDKDVCFVSTMFVSNETGAINDLEKIRLIIDEKNPTCIMHVDAVQGFGKIKFNFGKAKINLLSISAHKIGGIKGVGALIISNGTHINNINFGGNQEENLRSGTINASGNLSFYASICKAYEDMNKNFEIVSKLKDYLCLKLKELNIKNLKIVSDKDCSPYIVSLVFENMRGETIMRYLSSKDILVGTGSACSTTKVGNRVLENMGYKKSEVLGAIRISFCSTNTLDEIDMFISNLKNCLTEVSL